MPVETFDCKEFERTLESIASELDLPGFHDTLSADEFYWARTMKQGEYTYWLQLDPHVALEIRSSIDASGVSATTGEDSIRVWMVSWNRDVQALPGAAYLGGKVSHHTTRVKGWQERLGTLIGKLNALRLLTGNCRCDKPLGVFKVKKEGPTKGKLFASCKVCNTFRWVEMP